jgi:Tfp pilus assembly protein PilN
MIGIMRLGLALGTSTIGLVALKGRRVVHAFTVEGQEQLAEVLRAESKSRRIPWRKARVGIPRSLTVVKTLQLPPVVEGNLARMVAFELERHLPFPTEEACFDFVRFPEPSEGPIETLVVAAERKTVDRSLRLLEEAGLRPLSLTVAAHDLVALVGRWSRTDRTAWLHRAGEEITLLLLEGGHLRLSRSLSWIDAETLAEEIRKSLTLFRWRDLAALWVSGDGSRALGTSAALADFAPVTPPPFSRAASRLIEDLGDADTGLTLLALGVALGPRRPSLNLLPESLRPRQVTPGQLATGASLAVTALLGLSVIFAQGYREQRYLDQLNKEIRKLDPEVRAAERLSAELEKKRRFLTTVKSLEESSLKPLPFLRELTEIIPPDAWLTTLNLDAKGVELMGQAAAANQLIPLLENSSRLEKVEFASPVTRARDKEQFRIRASWETAPKPVQAAASQAGPRGKASR